MDSSNFPGMSPSIVNQAIMNLLIRYELIKYSTFDQAYYDTPNKFYFSFIENIKKVVNIGTSIEAGSGAATLEEYGKVIETIIDGIARIKSLSVPSIKEMIATEANKIREHLIMGEIGKELKQKEIKSQIETFVNLGKICLGALLVFLITTVIARSISEGLQNKKEVEQTRVVNQELNEEKEKLTVQNKKLASELEGYKKFTKEKQKLNSLQAENEELQNRVESLNNRLYRCKNSPIWNRDCD